MTSSAEIFHTFSPRANLSEDRTLLMLGGANAGDRRSIPLDFLEDEIVFLEHLAPGMTKPKWEELISALPPVRRLELLAFVETLRKQGFVVEQLRQSGEALLTREITSNWYQPCRFDHSASFEMSRFALLRSYAGGMLLESPRSHARVVFSAEGLLHCTDLLFGGVDLASTSDRRKASIAKILVECGFLVQRNPDGSNVEENERHLQDWDFHDLLFHARSRTGRNREPYGKIEPGDSGFDDGYAETDHYLTILGDPIALPKPDLENLSNNERSFSQVLESRRSRRRTPATPLTVHALAEFLFRSARITNRENRAALGPWRPFATAAAMNDLDIFLNVVNCEGLEPGLYRYDALSHALERIQASLAALERLELFSGTERQGVHFLIAARFGKLNCRYNAIAYSLILRNVGCLLQTMYLVATALDRAPCAIGAGDADAFAKITGLPYELQGTVGDFVLR